MRAEIATKLNLDVPLAAMQQDYLLISTQDWSLHYNTADYNGTWTSIALRSISGKMDDIRSIPDQTYLPTPAVDLCPTIKSFLAQLNFTMESVRLLRLGAGSIIKPHRDRGLGYDYECFRLHIPLYTSGQVKFIVDGMQVDMAEGECWYANFDLTHSVENPGSEDRVHLVIDGIRNEWTDELFSNAGYDTKRKVRSEYSESEKEAIKKELSRMGTDVAIKLIEEIDNDK